ncbi:MAG: hypothetical protein ACP5N7_05050 [Candidatus Pacearchaeota archaeon]
MNITTEASTNNQEYEIQEDNTGLVEIQSALEEIEKLKNSPEEENEKKEETGENEKSTAVDEQPEEEASKKKDKKLWKEIKRKYQVMAEKENLLKENAQLRQMLEESLNSGTYHYGKSAYAELEKAKEDKKRAIEEGNVDGLIEADLALTKSINAISELEKWANTGNPTKTQTQQPVNNHQQYGETEAEIIADWLEDHTDLQPMSPKYNPTLANQVADFVNRLDSAIAHNGRNDAYFSEEYFNAIDNYISELKKSAGKAIKTVESASHVGGVRNSYSSSPINKSSGSKQMILTADEKRMCANSGIKEEDWLKYKLEDLKKGK